MQISLAMRRLFFFLYILFISVLFVLPGSAFPKQSWLDAIFFDKWVHIGLFALAAFIGGWAGWGRWKLFWILVVYGLIVELVQDRWVANRSMDMGDWLADGAGALIGGWIAGLYKKK